MALASQFRRLNHQAGQSDGEMALGEDLVAHGSVVVLPRRAAVLQTSTRPGQYRPSPIGTKDVVCSSRCQASRLQLVGTSIRRGTACRAQRLAVLRSPSPAHRSLLSALGRSQRASGVWGGAKIGRANGRSPSFWPLSAPLPPSARRRFPRATTALRYDFGAENPVERTLSSTPSKPCHRLFTFFLLTASTT